MTDTPTYPLYLVVFMEDVPINGDTVLKGTQLQMTAAQVFSLKGKALVYDWSAEAWTEVSDQLPRMPG